MSAGEMMVNTNEVAMLDSERDQMLTQATRLHQQGNLPEAERLYRQLLSVASDDNIAYLLGTLLLQQGNAARALEYLEPLAKRCAGSADLQNNLGVAYQMLQRPPLALQAFQAAIKADSSYPQAYLNLGKLLQEAGNWGQAEGCYRAAATLLPEDLETRCDWINALLHLQQWDSAGNELENLWSRLASLPRREAELTLQLAFGRIEQKRYEEAVMLYERQLSKQPASPEMLANLSCLYEHTGKLDQALDAADRAIALAPLVAELHNNRGVALRAAHRLEEAGQAFRQAISLKPDFPLARFNLGSLLLLAEQYPEGWQGYESRTRLIPPPPGVENLPVWSGAPLPGETLLVYCDQGFGDALQFVRFLPRLQQRAAARIVLLTPPELMELFRHARCDGKPLADEFLAEGSPLPQATACFPLLGSGALLGLTLSDLSPAVPYLQPPPGATPETGKGNNRLKVGLCWRGNAAQARDHVRSMPLLQLQALASVPGVDWYSLQQDARPEELQAWPVPLTDWGSQCASFADTARRIAALDLLITVDTAVCHLAGGLGANVWTLLAHTPDWRWHLRRTDAPWYPSMRLFRQPDWGNWNAVVQDVQRELAALQAISLHANSRS
ncbi:MAG: tetratricopeptide repeat protein [Planctomycetaceae bacterium]|nr:tetratricopeptide repeat protein [Planctomycetaceae bacterium]